MGKRLLGVHQLQLDAEAAGPPAAVEPSQGQDVGAQALEGRRARPAAAPVAGRCGLSLVSEARHQPPHGPRRQPQRLGDGLRGLSLLSARPEVAAQGIGCGGGA
jgi:hypothetical protein